jgi:protein TonB
LGGGFAGSVLFHGALVAAFFLLRPGTPPPSPPIYRVQLFAAPQGERAIGVAQDNPPPTPPPKTMPAKSTPTPVAAKPAPNPRPKSVPAVKRAAPAPPVKAAQPKQETPQPKAGGGETGGKGADVGNVDTGGLDFPYPYYTANIVSKLIEAWGEGAPRSDVVVRFTIRRDGTVDSESIQIVTGQDYRSKRRAIGAVEQVANAKGFGTLPPGFREDILPVTVRFTAALFR